MIQKVRSSEQKPQWQKEIKESTFYSKRQKKISNGRTIRKTPTPRPIDKSPLAQI